MLGFDKMSKSAKALLDIGTRLKLAETEQDYREHVIALRDACMDAKDENMSLRQQALDLREQVAEALAAADRYKQQIANEDAYAFSGGFAFLKNAAGEASGEAFCSNCLRGGERVRIVRLPSRRGVMCPKCQTPLRVRSLRIGPSPPGI